MKTLDRFKRRTVKKLTPLVKHLLSPKTIMPAVIIVLVLCAGVSALVVQHNHNKLTHIIVSPTSSTDSNSTLCVLGEQGCSKPSNSSTLTPTTQTPAKTQSAPPTTSTPTTQTQATYPSYSEGVVTTSPTCHYLAGYGEAYYRNVLVQAIWADQSSTASEVSSSIDQYEEQSGEYQYSYQQELGFVNNFITIFNNYISSSYSEYVSNVNSIGCTTTIDTTNIPQVPACADLSGTVCDDSIWAISIPSLE